MNTNDRFLHLCYACGDWRWDDETEWHFHFPNPIKAVPKERLSHGLCKSCADRVRAEMGIKK